MNMQIRPITPDERRQFAATMGTVFGFELKEAQHDWWDRVVSRVRTVAAFDDGQMVATGGAYSLRLSVPGGAVVPAGGTTMIAVAPTHRRRGLLRDMMEFHLDDVAEREEPLAALWASESSIYQRFGFGTAAYQNRLKIDRGRARLTRRPDVTGAIRLVPKDEALPALMGVYDRVVPSRPGMLARSEDWWQDEHLQDFEEWRDGRSALRIAVYSEGDEPLGYVRYRTKSDWDSAGPKGTIHVGELMAVTEEVSLALWDFVFGVDLMEKIDAWNRPPDDTLRWHLAEPRRLAAESSDSLWVRVMDVPAALSARRYAQPGGLVLEVHDEFVPAAGGRFALDGGPDGAECARTDAEPDVSLSLADLGALYLGGNRAAVMGRAGRVRGSREAVARLDAMFAWDPAPWCPEVF